MKAEIFKYGPGYGWRMTLRNREIAKSASIYANVNDCETDIRLMLASADGLKISKPTRRR